MPSVNTDGYALNSLLYCGYKKSMPYRLGPSVILGVISDSTNKSTVKNKKPEKRKMTNSIRPQIEKK